MPTVLRTILGSSPTTLRSSPYNVSPKIHRSRLSSSGMEYAASAPCHPWASGKEGSQLSFGVDCANKEEAQSMAKKQKDHFVHDLYRIRFQPQPANNPDP